MDESSTTLLGIVLDEQAEYSFSEMCRHCHVSGETLLAMVEEGVLLPQGMAAAHWRFPAHQLQRALSALRLQHDLGVNLAGAALALELLEELQKARLRARVLEQMLE